LKVGIIDIQDYPSHASSKFPRKYLTENKTDFFEILSNSLYTNHPVFRLNMVRNTDSIVKQIRVQQLAELAL